MIKTISKSDFESFLHMLDPNVDKAGEKYLELRAGLESFFEWRDCENIEELTDIVFDRLTKKIIEGEKIENIKAYSVSIAKFVVMEHKRKLLKTVELVETHTKSDLAEDFESTDLKKKKLECLRKCLSNLPEKKRDFLIEYYNTEEATMIDKRRKLADKLQLNLNSLRIQVSRMKSVLEKCTKECCGEK